MNTNGEGRLHHTGMYGMFRSRRLCGSYAGEARLRCPVAERLRADEFLGSRGS